MFDSSHVFLPFDDLRVPYAIRGDAPADFGRLQSSRNRSRQLLWALGSDPEALPFAGRRVGSLFVFARIVPDDVAGRRLGTGWTPTVPVLDDAGRRVASIWRDGRGSVFLPFDPAEAISSLLSERYRVAGSRQGLARRARRSAIRAYYGVRPALPRAAQIRFRRALARVQVRTRFPRWPAETALHDLYDLILAVAADVAGESIPWIAPWPDGKRWALVLTHDVETAYGCSQIPSLRDVERETGFRSSWNFVARRYDVDDELVSALASSGCEVGVHGLHHDGRDLASFETLQKRLPEIRAAADRWRAVGFRSPATHRDWALMPLLGFDYDSSYPDSDPFEPQGGGCCCWWPFFNGDLVELPITLTQDHTAFAILRQRDERLWVEKAELLRARGGMALLITHPDYIRDGVLLGAYRRLLERYQRDDEMWRPLPREAAAWWRRRACSSIECDSSGWKVVGPAADEAAISWVEPAPTPHAAYL